MYHKLVSLIAVLGFLGSTAVAQDTRRPVPPVADNDAIILDLDSGSIFGATIGMDEAATRKALAEHALPEIKKSENEAQKQFSLTACPGVTFWFRRSPKLNEIYTNHPNVSLSNGLMIGQKLKAFTALLGPPSPPHRLPSLKYSEFTYNAGKFDLRVICSAENPEVVLAMRLCKRQQTVSSEIIKISTDRFDAEKDSVEFSR
jgi:hypothetical protein